MGFLNARYAGPQRPTPAQRLYALADRLERLTFTSEADERLTKAIAQDVRAEAEKLEPSNQGGAK